jgi:hypothetical protein
MAGLSELRAGPGRIDAMPMLLPIDQPTLPPRQISARLRNELVYFATVPVHPLGEGEYTFDPSAIESILDDGAIRLVSPLDTANMTEVELSEEQEDLLTWLRDQNIKHVRVS